MAEPGARLPSPTHARTVSKRSRPAPANANFERLGASRSESTLRLRLRAGPSTNTERLCSLRGMSQQPDIKPRSRDVTDGLERAAARGMLRAVGMQDADFAKPQIGVASSW